MKAILQVFETRAVRPEVERAASGFEETLQAVGETVDGETAVGEPADGETADGLGGPADRMLVDSDIDSQGEDASLAAPQAAETNPDLGSYRVVDREDINGIAVERQTETPASHAKALSGPETSAWQVLQTKTQHGLQKTNEQPSMEASDDQGLETKLDVGAHPADCKLDKLPGPAVPETPAARPGDIQGVDETARGQADSLQITESPRFDRTKADAARFEDRASTGPAPAAEGPQGELPTPDAAADPGGVPSAQTLGVPVDTSSTEAASLLAPPPVASEARTGRGDNADAPARPQIGEARPVPAGFAAAQAKTPRVIESRVAELRVVESRAVAPETAPVAPASPEALTSNPALLEATPAVATPNGETTATHPTTAPGVEPIISAARPSSAEAGEKVSDVARGAPVPIQQRRLFEFSAEAKFRAHRNDATQVAAAQTAVADQPAATATTEQTAAVQKGATELETTASLAVEATTAAQADDQKSRQQAPVAADSPTHLEAPRREAVELKRIHINDAGTLLQMRALKQRAGPTVVQPNLQNRESGSADVTEPESISSQPSLLSTDHPVVDRARHEGRPNAETDNRGLPPAETKPASEEGTTLRPTERVLTNATNADSTASKEPATSGMPLDASPADTIAAAFARSSGSAATLLTEPAARATVTPTSPVMPGEGETFDSVVSLRDAETAELQVGRGDDRVKVILRERGEHIHVSAQTATPELAQALLSDAGELGTSLENHGFDLASFEASADERAESDGDADPVNEPDSSQTMQTVLHRRRIVA